MPPSSTNFLPLPDPHQDLHHRQIFQLESALSCASASTSPLSARMVRARVRFLRIIAGIEHSNGGDIASSPGLRITYLPQEAKFTSDNTLREEARLAFAPVLEMQPACARLSRSMGADGVDLESLMDEYDRLSVHFESASGYDIEHRVDEVLQGLGFTQDMWDDPVARLSGGQKTPCRPRKGPVGRSRSLAARRANEPPRSRDAGMAGGFPRPLAWRVSDCQPTIAYFLDRTTTRTLDLSFGRLEDYPASYAKYLPMRAERRARHIKEYEEQQEYIQRQEEFIRKYGAGQRYREARGRQKKLDRTRANPTTAGLSGDAPQATQQCAERTYGAHQQRTRCRLPGSRMVRRCMCTLPNSPLSAGIALDCWVRTVVAKPHCSRVLLVPSPLLKE